MPGPRWVVVDDTSVDINYTGPWFTDVGSQDGGGNFGPAFLSTLHGTNSSASFALSFTGTTVIARGSSYIRNDSGVIDPQWSCYVDGIGIPNTPPARSIQNNWQLCGADTTDGPHTIVVNVTVAKNQTFWFDRIDYVPSPRVPLANKTVLLTASYPPLQFGTGWTIETGSGNAWTQTQGSLLFFTFYGTSLSWYGHIFPSWNGNSTTATWAIDEGPAKSFLLKGHDAGSTTPFYNQKFFETEAYPFGPHTLTVTYNGDSSKTTLYLAYLVVQNDTGVGSTSTYTTSSQTAIVSANSTTYATPSQTASTKTPAVIGGVIGGVVCFFVVVVLYIRFRKKKEARLDADSFPSQVSQIPHDSLSRLPDKVSQGVSGGSGDRRAPTVPSGMESDPTGQITSSFVGPPQARLDNPPAYTQG